MKKIYLQIFLLFNIFLAIIWYYPRIIDFLIIHNRHYSVPNEDNKIDLIAERGTFGDMYGLLNTVFSGIALLGVVYTIYEEKEKIRGERLQSQKDKIAYFSGVLTRTALVTDKFINYYEVATNIDLDKEEDYTYFIGAPRDFMVDNSQLEKLVNSFNREEYFLAYLENINTKNVDYIERVNHILVLLENLNNMPNMLKELIEIQNKYVLKVSKIKNEIVTMIDDAVAIGPNQVDEIYQSAIKSWKKSNQTLFDMKNLTTQIFKVVDNEMNSPEPVSSSTLTLSDEREKIKRKIRILFSTIIQFGQEVKEKLPDITKAKTLINSETALVLIFLNNK